MKSEMYTPYWRAIPADEITAEQLVSCLVEFGLPHQEEEALFESFAAWWSYVSVDVRRKAMDIDEWPVLDAMMRVDGADRALRFWNYCLERKELQRAEKRQRELDGERARYDSALEAAQLEVLRLKAEIYDMQREAKEGA